MNAPRLELRLYLDRLAAKASASHPYPVDVCAVYVVEGAVAIVEGSPIGTLGANSAFSVESEQTIRGGSMPAAVLRWELTRRAERPNLLSGDGIESRLLLAAPMRFEIGGDYLLRCDRVDFPPGGEALTHIHAGAGIRCLLAGGIRIDTPAGSHRFEPLGAWFEAGPEPVYAAASATEATSFARVMILPVEYLGRSSISYVRQEDLDKPKRQSYQVFIDRPFLLPGGSE